jgi:uncharacterized membrane protein (UPF0127 family)
MKPGFVAPLLRRSSIALCIRNERNGRVLADSVLSAFDSKTRRAGLLGRDSLPDNHAMVIAPTNAVHTWFMRFSIDLAFVDRTGRVVKTYQAVKPWRVAGALRAYAVVELAAGSLARNDTVTGDMLAIVPDAVI